MSRRARRRPCWPEPPRGALLAEDNGGLDGRGRLGMVGPLSGIRGIQDGGVCCHPGLLFSAIAAAVWLGIWAPLCILQQGLLGEQLSTRPASVPNRHPTPTLLGNNGFQRRRLGARHSGACS